MTDSLSPHCILTEPARKNVSGKGREGKGREGKGSQWFSSHHGVTHVTRERAAAPTAPAGTSDDMMPSGLVTL